MIVEVPHPERVTFKTVGCPLKLSGSPVEVTASPLLSEHTDDILADVMGDTPEKIAQLRQDGVV
jgi:formyl-CoA transferase